MCLAARPKCRWDESKKHTIVASRQFFIDFFPRFGGLMSAVCFLAALSAAHVTAPRACNTLGHGSRRQGSTGEEKRNLRGLAGFWTLAVPASERYLRRASMDFAAPSESWMPGCGWLGAPFRLFRSFCSPRPTDLWQGISLSGVQGPRQPRKIAVGPAEQAKSSLCHSWHQLTISCVSRLPMRPRASFSGLLGAWQSRANQAAALSSTSQDGILPPVV